MTLSIIAFAVLFVLLFLEVPIAFGMAAVGFVGFAVVIGVSPALNLVGQIASDTVMNYTLSVVPLFVLMGNFVTQSRISHDLYDASNTFLGHRRGGLAMATIVACGGFSAVCGSSLATAATMSRIAIPSMRRFGYADSLAAGAVAAGGTLGILIPPSVILVLYGAMTEQNVAALFAAGILPGIIGILLYIAAIAVATAINPALGPRADRTGWAGRFRALTGVWGVLLLFSLVMGGIYFGVFTPTEAAGIGASGAFLIAALRGTLTVRSTIAVLIDAARTTAMMFIVLIGALIFANFINMARLPNIIADWVQGLDASPIAVIFIILVIYVVLGCILESLSMMLLTVPLFYPMVSALGFDLVWFGIFVVVAIELSLITPPIGLNVFVLKAMLPDVETATIFRGVVPFIVADFFRLAILVFFPGLVLFLPRLME